MKKTKTETPRFCPKQFGHDMTDRGNLEYCHSIQTERCRGCEWWVEEDDYLVEVREQGRLW